MGSGVKTLPTCSVWFCPEGNLQCIPSVPVSAMLHDECFVVPVRLHGTYYKLKGFNRSFTLLPTFPALDPRSKLQASWNLRSAPSSVNGFANPILHIYTLPVTRVQLQLRLVLPVVSGGKPLPLLRFEEEKPWRIFLFSIHTNCTPLHLTTSFEIRAEWIPRRVVIQSMG